MTTIPRTTAELRHAFLSYFESLDNNHMIVKSAPLVPANDPTLLFTNAGMVQFKETFLGQEPRAYQRATSCQRCVRAGGKHNDLENVGYTARHHTFFEMLGNFSFGDYFKQDAIRFAWTFLTEVLQLPADKLWITVYEEDDETANIWLKDMGVSPAHFSRCGAKDNFWSMGDTGPCGPCTEIFYDHGADVAGGPPGSPDEEGDRYIEIWNLVFMQYDRDAEGVLHPLPKPSVDTGMGLERLAAVMQGVHNNYDIDLFQVLLQAVANATGHTDTTTASVRVIADHIRACAFLVIDGVVPSNEGRGYVLRRIIRRAVRHGHKLGQNTAFFYTLVDALDEQMGEAYPELRASKAMVKKVLKQEEARFAETLDHGMKILEVALAELKGTEIGGDLVFKLYDTYGFPTDLTADIAREHRLTVDLDGFETAMATQKKRARAASQFAGEWSKDGLELAQQTHFTGYDGLQGQSTVLALFQGDTAVDSVKGGDNVQIVLDSTPFYAESGGQMGDKGMLSNDATLLVVQDTQKLNHAFLHLATVQSGVLSLGDTLNATVDTLHRMTTARNHSATHLLHAALRQTLGEHVKQKGSLVSHQRLRFDFSHFEPINSAQVKQIERIVNTQILLNTSVQTELMDLETAKNSGAMALFGEKYDQKVRVLSIGEFSTELCGGTHVKQAGDIGLFKITNETGVAAGVRRLEAVTGEAALDWLDTAENQLDTVSRLLKSTPDQLEQRIQQLLEQNKNNEKVLAQLQAKLASSQGDDLLSQAVDVKGIKVLAVRLDNTDPKRLRDTLDQLKDKLGQAAIVLAAVNDDKISLVAGVSQAETKQIKAGALVNHVAQQVGGKGGGRPDMAQAGGNNPAALDAALTSVVTWVDSQL